MNTTSEYAVHNEHDIYSMSTSKHLSHKFTTCISSTHLIGSEVDMQPSDNGSMYQFRSLSQ